MGITCWMRCGGFAHCEIDRQLLYGCRVEIKAWGPVARRWLGGFSCFIAAVLALGTVRSFTFFWGSYSAASRLHNAMLGRVLHAPLAFFHANSAGRILNRFSKDQGITDDELPLTFFDALQSSFMVAGASSYVHPCACCAFCRLLGTCSTLNVAGCQSCYTPSIKMHNTADAGTTTS